MSIVHRDYLLASVGRALIVTKVYVGSESLYFRRRKVLEELEVLQTMDGTFESSIVADLFCLVEVDVRMLSELVECQLVDVELPYFMGGDMEIG